MPNQAKIMKGGIVLSTALVALLLRSSPVIADDFFISAMHSQKCMQVDGAEQDDFVTISQWDCVNQPNVLWRFRGGPPGFFNLEASHSGKCAFIPWEKTDGTIVGHDNGNPVLQEECFYSRPDPDRTNWVWRQQPVGGGYYFIINKASNKCMQVNGGSQDNGAAISQWDCVDQPNVKWKMPLFVAHPL
jgi:hypothetical protein